MDDFDIDRKALVETFVAEADEILADMEATLVRLETKPDDADLVHAIFRAAHTLKGSAALVGFAGVSEIAHHLEDLLARVRDRSLQVTDATVTLLLRSVDVLRDAIRDAGAEPTVLTDEAKEFLSELARVSVRPPGEEGRSAPEAPAREDALRWAPHSRTLRLDVARLDGMLDLVGEVEIARGRLADILERRTAASWEDALEVHRHADRLMLDLQDLVIRSRMVPLGPVFQQQRRTLRDVAGAQQKLVHLAIEGGEVEVDTAVVERLKDPLTHMVRNAIDHGIEAPHLRHERGKEPAGRITLRARRESGAIVIEVEDDGEGIDTAKVLRRAEALGLLAPGERPAPGIVRQLIFHPGLSTSQEVTEISGRGVGMDVVRRSVEALRGSVDVESAPGQGTTFTIRVPLTLCIIPGFRVQVRGEVYVLPLDTVQECIELPEGHANQGASGVLELRGAPLSYIRLSAFMGLSGEPPGREKVLVLSGGANPVGLVVDELIGESQTVVKPLTRFIGDIPGVWGSAVMGDGRVALVLETEGLIRAALGRGGAERAEA